MRLQRLPLDSMDPWLKGYTTDREGEVYRPDGSKQSLWINSRRYGRSLKQYLYFQVWRDGKRKSFYVHRCQAWATHGPPPKGKPYATHINDESFDNRRGNIRWASERVNSRDKCLNGRAPKLLPRDVHEIRALLAFGFARKWIAAAKSISISHVGNIATGRVWGWLQ